MRVRLCVGFLIAMLSLAQTPSAVLDVLRGASRALTEQKPAVFLDYFDPAMPDYRELEANVAALTALGPVSTTIEIAGDTGTDLRREMRIDWLMRAGSQAPKRAVLKMVVERRDGRWIIVALDRADFFRWTR